MNARNALRALLAVAALSLALAPGAQAAKAVRMSCGETITTNTKLANDLTNCPNKGIVIGADNITLDLNGHMIDGDGESPGEEYDLGIDNTAGHDGITIQGGSIREFVEGVLIEGARENLVRDISTSHQLHAGIFVFESTDLRVENNKSFSNIAGIVVARASHAMVERNSVSDSEFGGIPLYESDHVLVAKNSVSRNGQSGIFFFNSDHNLVVENRSIGNQVGLHLTEGSDHNRFESNRAAGSGFVGVLVEADDNLVRSNSLAGNEEGMIVAGSRNAITANRIGCSDGCGGGVSVEGGEDNLIAQNYVRQASGGILIQSFDPDMPTVDTVVRDNRVERAGGDGFGVATDSEAEGIVSGTLLERNLAIGSGDDGIDVGSASTTVSRNTANHNHDFGIEAIPGVTDGGGNKASGNGNPLQCTNVFCK